MKRCHHGRAVSYLLLLIFLLSSYAAVILVVPKAHAQAIGDCTANISPNLSKKERLVKILECLDKKLSHFRIVCQAGIPSIQVKNANVHVSSENNSNLGNVIVGNPQPQSYSTAKNSFLAGEDNAVRGSSQSVVGGRNNSTSQMSSYATICGGSSNNANGDFSSIKGGTGNVVSGQGDTICGGTQNTANGGSSVILGGSSNRIGPEESSPEAPLLSLIVGGRNNEIVQTSVRHGSICGGVSNSITSSQYPTHGAVVLGGSTNEARGYLSVVVGGTSNVAAGFRSVVVGGERNVTNPPKPNEKGQGSSFDSTKPATGDYTVIGGGLRNLATGRASLVLGGEKNETLGATLTPTFALNVICGGGENKSFAENSVICGGKNHQILPAGILATICGGGSLEHGNLIGAAYGTILGGQQNEVQGKFSTISGGSENRASGIFLVENGTELIHEGFSLVIGGHKNETRASYSTIVGGRENLVGSLNTNESLNSCFDTDRETGVARQYAVFGFVAGGRSNAVVDQHSAISGGVNHFAGCIGRWDHSSFALITGGSTNLIFAPLSTTDPLSNLYFSVISGGRMSRIRIRAGVINGGRGNVLEDPMDTRASFLAFICGGQGNEIRGAYGVICGGRGNQIGIGATSTTIRGSKGGVCGHAINSGQFVVYP